MTILRHETNSMHWGNCIVLDFLLMCIYSLASQRCSLSAVNIINCNEQCHLSPSHYQLCTEVIASCYLRGGWRLDAEADKHADKRELQHIKSKVPRLIWGKPLGARQTRTLRSQ